jgi:uncharacterized protein
LSALAQKIMKFFLKKLRGLVLPLVLCLSLFFSFASPLQALEFPEPAGFVNDFAGIFSSSFKENLETDLVNFEKETTIEISVTTVEDLQGTTIEDFAVRLFEEWGIGKKAEDNGLLLLVAPTERQVRIEVGYGLEPIITDSRAGRVIRNQITPEFKKGNFEKGVSTGVAKIKSYLLSDEPPQEIEKIAETAESNLPIILVAFFFLIYFSSFWGRSKRIWPGGLVGLILGLISGLIIGLFIYKIILPLIFALLGLLLDALLSRNYKKRKKAGRPTSWWRSGGGFFGGGSSSGGGFGGFSGGSSGGGGASGSW